MLNRKEKTSFDSSEKVNKLVEGTVVIGDIIAETNIRIDGEVQGNVTTSAKVIVGANGVLKGKQSNIQGDIYTSKLHIEEGAVFLGACKMGVAGMKTSSAVKSSEETENSLY